MRRDILLRGDRSATQETIQEIMETLPKEGNVTVNIFVITAESVHGNANVDLSRADLRGLAQRLQP